MSASPNNTVMEYNPNTSFPQGDIITDVRGNQWTIAPNGQITINGRVDTPTANVIELAYVNGQIWQENNQGLWWEKTTTVVGHWNYEGTYNPLSGATFNILGPVGIGADTSVNNIVAYNYTGQPASQFQQVPAFSAFQANGVYLYHDNYTIAGLASSVHLTGTSYIAGGSTFTANGHDHNNDAMPVQNDGTMVSTQPGRRTDSPCRTARIA